MLIALQASSRLCNMLFAQLQVRLASAEAFGAANIHLELLLGTTLNIAREGIRNALSRQVLAANTMRSNNDNVEVQARERRIQNVALLPLPIGLAAALAGVTLYARRLSPVQLRSHPDFGSACTAFLFGIVLELLAEPLYVAALRSQHFTPRIWAEGAGTLSRGAVTLAMMVWLHRSTSRSAGVSSSMLPFGLGQLAFGAAFLLVFVYDFIARMGFKETLKLYGYGRTKLLSSTGTFDAQSLRMSQSMARQNIVKHCLGEADKFAVARLTPLKDQGAYALASNYGSLVARLLYQPVEESSRLAFASKLGDLSAKPKVVDVQQAEILLRDLLAFHALLASFLLTFCPPLATPLLVLVAGQRWAIETQAAKILAVYGAAYLPAMAYNGLLEGFLQACASTSQLARYDTVLIGASALYIASVWLLTTFKLLAPEIALVMSSTISTSVRATYSFVFAIRFLRQINSQLDVKRQPDVLTPSALMPSRSFLLAMLLAAIPLWRSASGIRQSPWKLPWDAEARYHVGLGLTLAVLCASLCLFTERKTLMGAYRAITGRR